MVAGKKDSAVCMELQRLTGERTGIIRDVLMPFLKAWLCFQQAGTTSMRNLDSVFSEPVAWVGRKQPWSSGRALGSLPEGFREDTRRQRVGVAGVLAASVHLHRNGDVKGPLYRETPDR